MDESWVGHSDPDTSQQTNPHAVMLIPRLRRLIASEAPGTKLSITEWNFGAEETINGALAIADVLGIFGREGVDLACYWTYPPAGSPGYNAFKLLRNADGNNERFGDLSVQTTSPDQDVISAYGAIRQRDGHLTLLVINKDPVNDYLTTIRIQNEFIGGQAKRYRLDKSANTIQTLPPLPVQGNHLQMTFPAYSATLLDLTPHLPLQNGRQMASWPSWTEGDPITDALTPFGPALRTAYAWQNGQWQIYRPTLPAYANTLTKVHPGQGLWLEIKKPPDSIPLAPVTGTITVTINAGWNLLGYPVAAPSYLPTALGQCSSAVDAIFAWHDSTWDTWQPGAPAHSMALLPGEGFWLHATNPCTWMIGTAWLR